MAPTLLARAVDRGRAGARRLRGRLVDTDAFSAWPTGRQQEANRADEDPRVAGPPTVSSEESPYRPDDSADPGELLALRRTLTEELDRLARRQATSPAGPCR